MATTWTVYVLISATGKRTYVGVTIDPERRAAQHNGELSGGAKSTRAGRPWTIGAVYGPYPNRSEAQRAEYAVKQRRGRQRLDWEPAPSDDSR
jgi:predicted GIY-YIG superfamily endonuclease